MALPGNIAGMVAILLLTALIVSPGHAETSPVSPASGPGFFVGLYQEILSLLGIGGSDPPASADELDPTPSATMADTPAPAPAPAPVEMAYLEKVDCSVSDDVVTIYRCKGNVRVPNGIAAEVQVIAQYPDTMSYASIPVAMGGSNFTLRSFVLFPDLKERNQQPAFFVQLDTARYPVVMDGRSGIAYRNLPPAPAAIPALATRPEDTPLSPASADPAPGPVSRTFRYVLRGEPGSIPLPLHDGVYTGQKSLPQVFTCRRTAHDLTPCTPEEERRYYLKYLDEPAQESDLGALVREIRSRAADPDDQARIAISLVQNIPYDYATFYAGNRTGDLRYPYQVLYDNTGVCSEKSLLLAWLLRELGYGVALFSFDEEKHMTVGIQSPGQYAFLNSGYAFIETTAPTIPTDSRGDYAGTGKLTSTPELLQISDGIPFTGISEEYEDASAFNRFGEGGTRVLSPEQYRRWEILMWKYGLHTSDNMTITGNPAGRPLCGDGMYCNGRCWNSCPSGAVPQCSDQGLVCYT